MTYKALKKKAYNIVEKDDDSFWSKAFDVFIIGVILLNVLALILETVPSYNKAYGIYFKHFEFYSIIIFTLEYALRVWVITEIEKYKRPIIGRVKYLFSITALIDLFAILPFFLVATKTIDGRILKLARAIRIIRIFKLNRYAKSADLVKHVLYTKRAELGISMVWIFLILLISSSLVYFAEHDAQPEVFESIPAALWWGINTLTTVGYGDIVPITVTGKILGGIISLLGIGVFALPAGILSNGFSQAFNEKKEAEENQKRNE